MFLYLETIGFLAVKLSSIIGPKVFYLHKPL